MNRLRVYIDTSVVGGAFDPEFEVWSRRFLDQVHQGEFVLLVSDLLLEELEGAPTHVREELAGVHLDRIEVLTRDVESRSLRDAYIDAGVVGKATVNDALHVAMATIARSDLIVSWNFRHLVNIQKIRAFNAVNLHAGYGLIDIRSPREVLSDG